MICYNHGYNRYAGFCCYIALLRTKNVQSREHTLKALDTLKKGFSYSFQVKIWFKEIDNIFGSQKSGIYVLFLSEDTKCLKQLWLKMNGYIRFHEKNIRNWNIDQLSASIISWDITW